MSTASFDKEIVIDSEAAEKMATELEKHGARVDRNSAITLTEEFKRSHAECKFIETIEGTNCASWECPTCGSRYACPTTAYCPNCPPVEEVVEPCNHTDDDICQCACHDPDFDIMHCVPCCWPCKSCGRDIPV